MEFLLQGLTATTWQQLVMYVIGAILIYLAISKNLSGVVAPHGIRCHPGQHPVLRCPQYEHAGIGEVAGILEWMFEVGIEASEAMPLLLFIGIGAMIDFGPLLSNPKLVLFGAAAQFGIFATITIAALLGFRSRMPPRSASSAPQTVLPRSSSPKCSRANMWEPSRWPPTHIWRSCPSSSHSPSSS